MGVVDGNWINDDVEYGIAWPKWERNVAKAKQLMAEAGYPNGFNVDWVTPVPNYYSRGERIVAQLQSIGIRSKLQVMERGVFLKRLEGGLKEWPGVQIIMNATRIGGTWSNWYDSMFKCGGFNGKDRFCVTDLDDKFKKYLASSDREGTEEPGGADPAGDPGELLFRPGLPPRLCQCDRAAHRGEEMAGRLPNERHARLCLSVGGPRAERDRLGGKVTRRPERRRRWASS